MALPLEQALQRVSHGWRQGVMEVGGGWCLPAAPLCPESTWSSLDC